MHELVVYGIDTCDQVRKARQWLRARDLEHRFHDFRRDGLDRAILLRWAARVPWDSLLNRRGQTWRRLEPAQRAGIVDQSTALSAMLSEVTLIKRPVLETGDQVIVGFNAPLYERLLGTTRAG